MEKKHILITYANTGSGHKTPAEAVAAVLEERYPGRYRITLSDFFFDAGQEGFNEFICKGWDWLLAHPGVNFFNLKLSQMLYKQAHLFLPFLYRKAWKGSMAYLSEVKPDIVFTTHFYCQNVAVDARARYGLNYPVVTLNPDSFETFPQWDYRSDLMLVNSSMAYGNALKLCHEPEKLLVVPQALRKDFDSPKAFDKEALRRKFGLPEKRFTLFLSDGGQGIGAMKKSIEALIGSGLELNALCICGRNKELLKDLEALGSHPGNLALKVYGYTDQIAELLATADLFVGKGGPASVLEALKMKLPAVITYAVNTAETNTRTFFVGQKMAWACPDISTLPSLVERLMKKPAEYQEAVEAVSSSRFFENGSPIIADIIVKVLENPESLADLVRQEKEQSL